MTLLVLIALCVWAAATMIVVAACLGASRGDGQHYGFAAGPDRQ